MKRTTITQPGSLYDSDCCMKGSVRTAQCSLASQEGGLHPVSATQTWGLPPSPRPSIARLRLASRTYCSWVGSELDRWEASVGCQRVRHDTVWDSPCCVRLANLTTTHTCGRTISSPLELSFVFVIPYIRYACIRYTM